MKSKWLKKLLTVVLTLALVVTSFNIVQATVSAASKTKATKITLNAKKQTIDIGATFKLSVKKVKPTDASKEVTWKSSDSKIATVDKDGVVTGIKKGIVVITATSKTNSSVSAKCKITVKDIKPTKVEISPSSKTLTVGDTYTFTAKVKPTNVNQEVKWSSSNNKVATIDKDGVVTAIKEGTTVITAQVKEDTKIKDTCKIIVKVVEPKTVEITPSDKTLKEGESFTLAAKVEPSGVSQEVIWTSSNSNVATVDANGVVKAIKEGTAVITAQVKANTKIQDTCNIKVEKSGPTPGGYVVVNPVEDNNNYVYTVPSTAFDFRLFSEKGNIGFSRADFNFMKEFSDNFVTLLKNWNNVTSVSMKTVAGVGIDLVGTKGSDTKTVTLTNAPKAAYSGTYTTTVKKVSDNEYTLKAVRKDGVTYNLGIKITDSDYQFTYTRNKALFTASINKELNTVKVKRENVQILEMKEKDGGYSIIASKDYVSKFKVTLWYYVN
jgi:uncharacterized protein YjdB